MSKASREIGFEDGLRLVPRLLNKGQISNAVRWSGELCRQRPDDPRTHNQAGLVWQRLAEPTVAVDHFRHALLLAPDAGEVWANLGTAFRHAADPESAFRCRQRAVWCRPELPELRLARSLSLLANGDYAAGFAEYEQRSERAKTLQRYTAVGMPVWDGSTRNGGRLLVVTEQGAGDVVQFLRFVEPLAQRGMEITLACPEPLERLARSAPGVTGCLPHWPDGGPTGHDWVEVLLSLPARLQVDRDTLPSPRRYLHPPAAGHRIPDGDELRVGLCWTGSTLTPLNASRRIPFSSLEPVLATHNVAFYGLQVWVGRDESRGESRLTDLAPYIDDFADTAAMIDQMDLVITVDTSVAHIAGALGTPVWTLLARAADWRWGYRSDSTPWYPSMRLFRQTRSGDWSDVVERVAGELRRLADDGNAVRPRRPFASLDPSG